jgi:Na+/H+ antiporter NhaD/arsenite permease-like protein
MAKKALVALVIIFVIFYLVSQPREAADGARTILGGIAWTFNGIVTFFQSLAG